MALPSAGHGTHMEPLAPLPQLPFHTQTRLPVKKARQERDGARPPSRAAWAPQRNRETRPGKAQPFPAELSSHTDPVRMRTPHTPGGQRRHVPGGERAGRPLGGGNGTGVPRRRKPEASRGAQNRGVPEGPGGAEPGVPGGAGPGAPAAAGPGCPGRSRSPRTGPGSRLGRGTAALRGLPRQRSRGPVPRAAPPGRAHLCPGPAPRANFAALPPSPAALLPGGPSALPSDNGAGAHQHHGEALLQLAGLGHGQLQGDAVRPQLRLLRVHAPRVAHGGRSALLRAPRRAGSGLRAPRSPSTTAGAPPRRRPSWLAALALLPPGRARSGSGSSPGCGSPACRPHKAPLRPRPAAPWDS